MNCGATSLPVGTSKRGSMSILDHTSGASRGAPQAHGGQHHPGRCPPRAGAGASVVSLMRGEPDFRTPPHIVEAAIARAARRAAPAIPTTAARCALREAVAAKLARDNGVCVRPGHRDPGHDRRHARHLARALTAARRRRRRGAAARSDLRRLPLAHRARGRPCRGRCRAPIVRRPLRAVGATRSKRPSRPRTRVLLLNTPWNPVGTVLHGATSSRRSPTSSMRRDLLLISDEIYEAIIYDGRRHVSPGQPVARRCARAPSSSTACRRPTR